MGRKSVVKQLNTEQFNFVIGAIVNGFTDREVSAAFEQQFAAPLAKSSLHRWRKEAGDELADRYRLARYQAQQLKEDMQAEGRDSMEIVIESIEDRLLAATREVTQLDPNKLLLARQEEDRKRQRDRDLDLKERKLELEREKMERAARVQTDRLAITADTWRFVLGWFAEKDGAAADLLTKYSAEIIPALEQHAEAQSA
jgi:hypothetical protein